MGKFEKKLKNKLKQDIQEFDEWYDMNNSKFPQFEGKSYTKHDKVYARTLIKAKSLWITLAACCTVLILGILMIFNFAILNNNNGATFSDDSTRYQKTPENDRTKLVEQYPFLNKLLIEDSVDVLYKEDDSLVATIVNGDIESPDNYYLCRVMFVYNKNFIFSSREIYNYLGGSLQKDSYSVMYSTEGRPFDGWYKNYILLETKSHQKIYIELECMYDDVTYILENVL